MNARTKEAPPQIHSAQELADMPLSAGRDALKAQECRHMQSQHAKCVLEEINARADGTVTYGRIHCTGLEDRTFVWEAIEHCETCDDDGQLYAVNGTGRECPDCDENAAELFYTDYDGNLVEEPA